MLIRFCKKADGQKFFSEPNISEPGCVEVQLIDITQEQLEKIQNVNQWDWDLVDGELVITEIIPE